MNKCSLSMFTPCEYTLMEFAVLTNFILKQKIEITIE